MIGCPGKTRLMFHSKTAHSREPQKSSMTRKAAGLQVVAQTRDLRLREVHVADLQGVQEGVAADRGVGEQNGVLVVEGVQIGQPLQDAHELAVRLGVVDGPGIAPTPPAAAAPGGVGGAGEVELVPLMGWLPGGWGVAGLAVGCRHGCGERGEEAAQADDGPPRGGRPCGMGTRQVDLSDCPGLGGVGRSGGWPHRRTPGAPKRKWGGGGAAMGGWGPSSSRASGTPPAPRTARRA